MEYAVSSHTVACACHVPCILAGLITCVRHIYPLSSSRPSVLLPPSSFLLHITPSETNIFLSCVSKLSLDRSFTGSCLVSCRLWSLRKSWCSLTWSSANLNLWLGSISTLWKLSWCTSCHWIIGLPRNIFPTHSCGYRPKSLIHRSCGDASYFPHFPKFPLTSSPLSCSPVSMWPIRFISTFWWSFCFELW